VVTSSGILDHAKEPVHGYLESPKGRSDGPKGSRDDLQDKENDTRPSEVDVKVHSLGRELFRESVEPSDVNAAGDKEEGRQERENVDGVPPELLEEEHARVRLLVITRREEGDGDEDHPSHEHLCRVQSPSFQFQGGLRPFFRRGLGGECRTRTTLRLAHRVHRGKAER